MTAYETQPDGTLREVAGPPMRADLVLVVRCRDCRFSLAHGHGCGRNQDIYDAEPDGFCAWGRRADG